MLCLCYVLLTDIRMENLGNLPSLVDMSAIRIVFSFRDEFENEIIQFSVIPGVAQMFFNDFLYIKSTACINEITKITKLKHTVGGTLRFGAILEVTREEARVPADWQIVKPIPMLHKFIVHYYPNNLSIITIRLTDGNGITALAITVDYELGILYTRRDRLDDGNVQCVNFGNSRLFINKTLAKVEISLLPYQYEVNITSNVNDSRNYRTVNMELLEQNRDISDHQVTVGITSSMGLYSARTSKCIVHGHHLYPYDIQRAIFDSTNKQSVFFAHFIEELNKHF
uniref:Uncharacterized protein n=1 Tax=Setaria digitata TaxID=48799 RepID=A0A915PL05_9BILA